MKNSILGIFFLVILSASCKKVDDSTVFNRSVDERLNEALANYQAKLSSEKNGWKGVLTTRDGTNFSFYLVFNDSNRVKMLSSFDSTSAVTLRESSFRIKALQQPSLLFDTYSYLHVLSDPLPSVNGGTLGEGLNSDFEFYFDDAKSTSDKIALVGRFNGSTMTLTRATAQEASAYASGDLARAFMLNRIITYYKRIVVNGTDSADVNINFQTSMAAATDDQGNLLDTARKSPFFMSLGGVTLSKPMKIGSKSVSEIKDLVFNAATGTITGNSNGEPVVIKRVGMPMKFDQTAAQRFKQYAINLKDAWTSIYGFHANGVDDALGITTQAPGYNGTIYAPKEVGFLGWTAGDLSGIWHSGGAGLRTTSFHSTITGGIIRFTTQAANVGLGPALPAAVNNLIIGTANSHRAYMQDAAGYYLVQTGPEAYDMVSAGDGTKWINWIWFPL